MLLYLIILVKINGNTRSGRTAEAISDCNSTVALTKVISLLFSIFNFNCVKGLNPTITSADYGLLPGDILLSVNGVPIREHTYNQIKESINSSVVLDRQGFNLQIFLLSLWQFLWAITRCKVH